MNGVELQQLAVEALQLTLYLVGPALLAALVAGAAFGLLQSATQIQDAALTFIPKLSAVAITLYFTVGAMRERLEAFAVSVLKACA